MKFIHAADVHLSEPEEDYGFEALAEILGLCRSRGADALVLAGDLFDSYESLKALYPRFRKELESAPCPVLAISGNHDLLRGPGDLSRFDFGERVRFVHSAPERSIVDSPSGACEFLLYPYGCPVAPLDGGTRGLPRVVVAHGALPELNWLGPESEEGESKRSCLDSRSITSLKPAYVALGHIHDARSGSLGPTLFAYPGSARVWRRGEEGPRTALLARIEGGAASCEPLALSSPGEYRRVTVELGESGGIDQAALGRLLGGCGPRDWLSLSFSGVAQREGEFRQAAEACRASLAAAFRKVDADCSEVFYLGDSGDTEAARAFRSAWESERARLEGQYGSEACLKALRIGLCAIADAQEARK
jgi:DNA repair exonuclease SbcCD nuclease subunit